MLPGERFANWIDSLSLKWKDRLRGWLLRSIAEGVTKFAEDMEPGAIESFRDVLIKVRDNPLTPPEMVKFYDKALVPGNWFTELIAGLTIAIGAIPALMSAGVPLGNLIRYAQDKELKTFRFDPPSVITAWRRDPAKYNALFADMKDQGMSDERIETLKFITEFLPSPRDLVEWQAKEVFEPKMVAKYGLSDEFDTLDLSLFAKVGVTPEQARNFWIAHWEHASWNQVVEMLRRGQLKEADLWDWFRLVEIPPYWRQKLINISWEVPTRVDVRRFWDMRTIDEARLREIYTSLGYHGKDLDDYVLWTKIYVDFPDLLARYKNNWIGIEDVKTELIAMGMKPERADTLIEEKVKKAAPERTADELKLTITDIYKGVKQNKITREEGVELIQYLGSTEFEARFKLDVNVPPDEEDKAKEERQVTKADILTGLKTAVITREEATAKLLELRYSAANVELLLKIFDAQVKPPTEVKLKEASKADIVLGVKKGIVTQEEGYIMLLDIDFSPEAALFILTVQTEESPFSPTNFAEFKDLTQKYRKAAGMEGKPMSNDIKKAAAEVVRLTGERDILQRSIEAEKRGLLTEGGIPVEATARLTELQAKLRQVEAELTRVKSEYDRLVVEFKRTV